MATGFLAAAQLLENFADVDQRGFSGETALLRASRGGAAGAGAGAGVLKSYGNWGRGCGRINKNQQKRWRIETNFGEKVKVGLVFLSF